MSARFHEIDGLRGWASLVVLLFHLSWEVFGVTFPVYRAPYLRPFIDGQLAVYVFFVLSGDALSSSYLRSRHLRALAKLAVKRYLRLAVPILASSFVTYFLIKQHLIFNLAAAEIINRQDWLGSFLNFEGSLRSLLKYSLAEVFTEGSPSKAYNPFLWPMQIELHGSYFIFGLLLAFQYLTRPKIATALIAAWLWALGSLYSLFFIGLLYSTLREAGFFNARQIVLIAFISELGITLLALADAYFSSFDFRPPQLMIFFAAGFVLLAFLSRRIVTFLSSGISRFLGRISFPLYLCQFPVIISYTSWAIIYFHTRGSPVRVKVVVASVMQPSLLSFPPGLPC